MRTEDIGKYYDYNLWKYRIDSAYKNSEYEFPKEKTLDSAIKIFKRIKISEKLDDNDKVNYDNELSEAKYDLVVIFGMRYEDLKGMTKNNIYLTHQSAWVNSIYGRFLKGACITIKNGSY